MRIRTRNSLFGLLLAGSALVAAMPAMAQNNWHAAPHSAWHPHPAPHFAHPFHAVVVGHVGFNHFTPAQRNVWIHGTWRHTWWNGRYGWWWNAGGVWFWYDTPVYPYPTVVSDQYYEEPDSDSDQGYSQGYAGGYWYYCQKPAGYYPYVRSCKGPWEPVPATPQQGGPDNGPGPGDRAGDEQGPPAGYNGDQGPPPGYGGDQGPPPGYNQGPGPNDEQGPPPGYGGDQGPPPGYGGDQGPPPGYEHGPPPGYNQGPQN